MCQAAPSEPATEKWLSTWASGLPAINTTGNKTAAQAAVTAAWTTATGGGSCTFDGAAADYFTWSCINSGTGSSNTGESLQAWACTTAGWTSYDYDETTKGCRPALCESSEGKYTPRLISLGTTSAGVVAGPDIPPMVCLSACAASYQSGAKTGFTLPPDTALNWVVDGVWRFTGKPCVDDPSATVTATVDKPITTDPPGSGTGSGTLEKVDAGARTVDAYKDTGACTDTDGDGKDDTSGTSCSAIATQNLVGEFGAIGTQFSSVGGDLGDMARERATDFGGWQSFGTTLAGVYSADTSQCSFDFALPALSSYAPHITAGWCAYKTMLNPWLNLFMYAVTVFTLLSMWRRV